MVSAITAVEVTAQALLTLYPNCSEAYEVLGLVAQKEGRRSEAKGFFQKARDLLERGEDTLLISHQDQTMLEQRRNRLRDDVSGVQ